MVLELQMIFPKIKKKFPSCWNFEHYHCGGTKITCIDQEFLHSISKCTCISRPAASDQRISQHVGQEDEYMRNVGQHEPLTTRLKNILHDYDDKGGMTIIKELVQNAEDAGASEFNILLDLRMHPTDHLKYPGMAKAHGPALIVHNNAKFTDDDFKNITKLAGATKRGDPDKIGKYGVGFCSVYHLTDIPSFVSDDWLYIFDPTLNYLKDHDHDHDHPGKGIKYTHHKAFDSGEIQKLQQLAPYHDLFHFNSTISYEGTIFRFPFRNVGSCISEKSFSKFGIQFMFNAIKNNLLKNGVKLLLFLNHVKRITLRTISASTEELIVDLNSENVLLMNFLYLGVFRKSINLKVISYSSPKNIPCQEWLLSKTVSPDKTERKVAEAAAFLKQTNPGKYECHKANGEEFCFLPLNVQTGLPIHISANFIVASNRTGINTKASWNKDLMQIAAQAYIEVLLKLKELYEHKVLVNYSFDFLFPTVTDLEHAELWKFMVSSFYDHLRHQKLLFSEYAKEWISAGDSTCKLMPCDFFHDSDSDEALQQALCVLRLPVVKIKQSLCSQIVEPIRSSNRSKKNAPKPEITLQYFVRKFIPNLWKFAVDHINCRNKVLFQIFLAYCFDKKYSNFKKDFFEKYQCVPCGRLGISLKLVKELIDPQESISKLVPSDSEQLPMECFAHGQVHSKLKEIGFKKFLPLSEVLLCANSIEDLFDDGDKDEAINKTIVLLRFLCACYEYDHYDRVKLNHLKCKEILPVLQRPVGYRCLWQAESEDCCNSSASKVFYSTRDSLTRDCILLGSQKYLLDVDTIVKSHGWDIIESDNWVKLLGINCTPAIKDVVKQFLHILDQNEKIGDDFDQFKKYTVF